jgi:hypothetical protein
MKLYLPLLYLLAGEAAGKSPKALTITEAQRSSKPNKSRTSAPSISILPSASMKPPTTSSSPSVSHKPSASNQPSISKAPSILNLPSIAILPSMSAAPSTPAPHCGCLSLARRYGGSTSSSRHGYSFKNDKYHYYV